MTVKSTDIGLMLSGGPNNNNPNNSIGGNISSFPITGSVNNLFSNLTTEEATVGKTDYRCFYLKNSSLTDSLFDCNIYISSQNSAGSSVQLGIAQVTDEQEIEITGAVISGNLLLKYKQQEFSVNWGGSAVSFSANLLSGLVSVGLNGVELSNIGSISGNKFKISFKGATNYKNHAKLDLFSNNLTGLSKPVVSIKKLVEGQPINSSAPLLAVETMIPSKVEFRDSSSSNRIQIGTIGPGEFVPVWVRRQTAPNTDFIERDFFIFKFSGSPFV